jgi:hypothetical protein
MYCRCGCSCTKLFFYLNAIYVRHTLEKKVNNIKGRVRRFADLEFNLLRDLLLEAKRQKVLV